MVTSPAKGLTGRCRVPSDKSISHRSLMFAALANGTSQLTQVLPSADVKATAGCLMRLGVEVVNEATSDKAWNISVKGRVPFIEPSDILDCGNSGTTMRLMSGLLAGQGIYCVLSGDKSLNKRPMGRVVTPLNLMGAKLSGREKNTKAPLGIQPVKTLKGIDYILPMASAQVKSAILLAGLFAEGETTVVEAVATRDHTERFMRGLGLSLEEPKPLTWQLPGKQAYNLQPFEKRVPADPSSAAFPIVAALLSPESELLLEGVGINPTRTGLIQALNKVGAVITIENEREEQGEPVADLRVKTAELKGDLHLKEADIPALVDEVPILMVAGLYLNGTLTVEGAEELRAKESDRLEAMGAELAKLGVSIDFRPDGFVMRGNPERTFVAPGEPFDSWHDHRIAMAVRILDLVNAQRQGKQWRPESAWPLQGSDIVNVSYPGFDEHLTRWQTAEEAMAL